MFNKYYQDELIYLRQLGREYAQAYPETAKLLAETGTDPDVERLLEGTAFITGRLRQKLDDELPELTHALLETFWPQLLRPIPALAVVQFEPVRATDKESRSIPRGAAIDSVPVDGTRCRFRTCFPVAVEPLRISQVQVRAHAPCQLTFRLRLHEGVKAGQLGIDRLRLHCAGVPGIAQALYLCLTRLVTGITLVAGQDRVTLPEDSLRPVGLDGEDALLDQAAEGFGGFALVHEYFAFPAKFLFVDLHHLRPALAQLAGAGEIQVECALSRLPAGMPQVSEANLLLGCTPVANEFPHQATPIRIEPERSEYKILPGGPQPAHFEITAVTSVSGVVQGQNKLRSYQPLYHQQRQGEEGGSYLVRRRPAVVGAGSECYLALSGTVSEETISIEALATNRRLAQGLGAGRHLPSHRRVPARGALPQPGQAHQPGQPAAGQRDGVAADRAPRPQLPHPGRGQHPHQPARPLRPAGAGRPAGPPVASPAHRRAELAARRSEHPDLRRGAGAGGGDRTGAEG